jgi:hypothetical protein
MLLNLVQLCLFILAFISIIFHFPSSHASLPPFTFFPSSTYQFFPPLPPFLPLADKDDYDLISLVVFGYLLVNNNNKNNKVL